MTVQCAYVDDAGVQCPAAATLHPVFLVDVRAPAGPVNTHEVEFPSLNCCAGHRADNAMDYLDDEGHDAVRALACAQAKNRSARRALLGRPIRLRHDPVT
jgi:hypothetical protein